MNARKRREVVFFRKNRSNGFCRSCHDSSVTNPFTPHFRVIISLKVNFFSPISAAAAAILLFVFLPLLHMYVRVHTQHTHLFLYVEIHFLQSTNNTNYCFSPGKKPWKEKKAPIIFPGHFSAGHLNSSADCRLVVNPRGS